MFYLHISNRTENLLAQLGTVLQADRQDPFSRELFLVQSQGMERLILQSLADQLGVFANFRFFFPLELLHYIAELLDLGISPDGFDRNILLWRLELLLRESDIYENSSLQTFLTGDNAARKRFQLARRLADCFDQYQLMRSEMIFHWQEGKNFFKDCSVESWQMALWQRLLAQKGGDKHRAKFFREMIVFLQQAKPGSLAAVLPYRISVFGVHTLPPLFLEYLSSLARHVDIHFYLLSPCKHYWGDIKGRGAWIHEALTTSCIPENEEEPFEAHPLLASLGRQGRDLQNIMVEIDFAMEFASYTDPVEMAKEEKRRPRLLEIVQSDLLAGRVHFGQISCYDSSLRIISCHSRLRELEVLRQHLLDLLEKNKKLQLRQIVVMAPDLQDYAPFIPAVFHDMEYSLADRSLRLRNQVVAAFTLFLSLFSGRFGRSEILELLQYQVVASRFSLNTSELEKISHWTEKAGVRWGLSANHRQNLGVHPFAQGSFRAGLDRLLMGYAVSCDDFIDGILPFSEIEGKEAQALGGFCEFIDFLDRTRVVFDKEHSLTEWEFLLQDCISHLFIDDNSADLTELRVLLASLSESERFTGPQSVEFQVIEDWFNGRSSESLSSSGFLRGQLTFCSMLPMRSIPFQVVCLLGLDDGVFPRSDRKDTFNLLAASRLPGDRSARSDDRYQFLEAILAARDTLYLSYCGQSEKNGEHLPPSVVVAELLELLDKGYGIKNIVVSHPLYPFSSRYFDNSCPDLFSYSEEDLSVAQSQQNLFDTPSLSESPFSWWSGTVEPAEETVSAGELLEFYKNPPAWFVRNSLGISFNLDKVDGEDSEMFEPDSLVDYRVNETLFQRLFFAEKKDDKEELLQKFQDAGQWPLGNPGKLRFYHHYKELEDFVAQAKSLPLGFPLPDRSLAVEICCETINLCIGATLTHRYEGGNLQVFCGRLKGYHLLSAWICHLFENYQSQNPRSTWLLTREGCGCFQQKHVEEFAATDLSFDHLVKLWQQGRRQPLPLYTEPAFIFARHYIDGKGNSLAKAVQSAQYSIDNGWEPEWNLLLAGKSVEKSLNDDFRRYAEKILVPLYRIFVESGGIL
ncbi:MAG: exodeoxyribonuclease V subunit gamma [Deltaproteobacteria bacterium]|nr:MAG: exodeoxyribonuclease V subunit gamma [Deltaproteobacteria bacterium]